jgi:hypothetical protein
MSPSGGSSSSAPERPEALRGGRYEIRGVLGEGTQGSTLEAVERLPEGGERRLAIKRFDVRGARSWKDYELAEREARVLQALSHPSLPAYVDHFEEDGSLYLVMERIEGESLAAMRRRGARLSEAEVARFLRDASDVLDYLHARPVPVIHRDIKPGNVIRRPDGSFAFVDFGAVRDKLRPEGGSTVVGTFGYMAPEQFQGRALPASDVYSVGATALAMLTGQEPETLPHRGLAVDVRAALGGRRGPVARALERMLDPDPDQRPSRIEPLLESPRSGPSRGCDATRETRQGAEAREQFERVTREYAQEFGRRVQRRAMRAAKRESRRIMRMQKRRLRHYHRGALPWPVALFLTLLFSVGMVAVQIATRVVVPVVLLLLSRFFYGSARGGLIHAALTVRGAGQRAVRAIGQAQGRFWERVGDPARSEDEERMGEDDARAADDSWLGDADEQGGARARVDVAPARARVAHAEAAGAGDEDALEEEDALEDARRAPAGRAGRS